MQTMLRAEYEQPEQVVLVWPERLKRKRESLLPFYRKFIELLSAHVPVTLLCTLHTVEKVAKEYAGNSAVTVKQAIILPDIWVRDFAPVEIVCEEKPQLLKFNYAPEYEVLSQAKIAEAAGQRMAQIVGTEISETISADMQLDGGQLVADGGGTIWCGCNSAKVEEANGMRQRLSGIFFGNEIKMQEAEPGDVTFHLDGTLRFIAPGLPVIARYPNAHPEQRRYFETLYRELSSRYLSVVVLENLEPETDQKGIPSAFGNYLNFLQVGKVIFMPSYKGAGLSEDANNKVLRDQGFDVIPVACDELSRLGGVLNCISWKYYGSRNLPVALDRILSYAAEKDYYKLSPNLAEEANQALTLYQNGGLAYSAYTTEKLRSFLFYESRRAHHFGTVEPFFEQYMRSIYSAILKRK